MARIVTFTSITLDGVVQAPAGADEDTRGGFRYGGWTVPYSDEDLGAISGEHMARGGALLMGRRTYEHMYSVWAERTDDNPFTDVLNNTQKYVASTTLREPLPWQNSTLLADVPQDVAALTRTPGKDIVVLGSGVLLRSLMQHDLVDEYLLLIYPVVLGSGHRLFADAVPRADLHLVDTKTTSSGVIAA